MLLCAVILMVIGTATPLNARADTDTVTLYVHTQRDMLNARRKPDKNSPVEMTLERGEPVEALRLQDGWVEIIGGEAGTAWCWAAYLAEYPPGEEAPVYTVASNGKVRVRQLPDGKTIRYVRNGDTVPVRFVIGGWAYIGDGYVMAEFLQEEGS